MRALLVFLLLFGLSGWAWTIVGMSTKDNRIQLLDEQDAIKPAAEQPGTWTLDLWVNRAEPHRSIRGLASVESCRELRRRIAYPDGRIPMAKCRLVEPQ